MPPSRAHAREHACRWLRAQLEAGPRHGRELVAEAAAVGISESTVLAAKRELGVEPRREAVLGAKPGMGRWVWQLSERQERQAKRAELIDRLAERLERDDLDELARQGLEDARSADGIESCEHCGRSFRPKKRRGQMYCRRLCASRAAAERARARKAGA
jgi:hypothetical protein